MYFERLAIPDVILITPTRHPDRRGYFSESFRLDKFREAVGEPIAFVQENHLYSPDPNTIRGFHYQAAPRAQGKLLKVMRGSILDFALDIRRGSPTYGQVAQAVLSVENGHQLWMPPGFAHAYMTLEPETHVLNKLTDIYHPETEGIIAWDDPDVAAPWPHLGAGPITSDNDTRGTALRDFVSPFVMAS
ncbi:dTDP-4-dehydrorhamnose 3,5-epimerase [Sphingomonas sp. 1P08PE]|uniref:dTDP-4-dehydrorhamnose 3,5-epimerase n=1 Tax=Sphingomonas sp. 1P08PE TaxID=554122 RepID=UPI0039A0428B